MLPHTHWATLCFNGGPSKWVALDFCALLCPHDLLDEFFDLLLRLVQFALGLNCEVGPLYLLNTRELALEDPFQLLLRHVRPLQGALALRLGRAVDNQRRINRALGARFEQQRNVDDDEFPHLVFVLLAQLLSLLLHQGVDDLFKMPQAIFPPNDQAGKPFAVHGISHDGFRERIADGSHGSPVLAVQPMHNLVCIDHGHASGGEHLRHRGLAHANAAGEP
mmetsp:Transcript_4104/g.10519  ORF Transcript_4104/g.10519 Transcript_4104/m.10519 type:complete len:221 (+) Transcript_4104:689-1351(+)